MKRIHTAGISFILCIAVCSCAEESDEIQPIDSAELTVSDETDNSVEVITTQSLSGETVSSDVTITTDREVYDNDCESVLLTIANNSDEMIEYGETWSLDKRLNGEWVSQDDGTAVFYMIGYGLPAGETTECSCVLSTFLSEPSGGEYRILKEIDDKVYAAEFKIEG
ncbi:MAG TPA: hypothetical protein H9681_03475 [Firmicutes bacterium]|nr:hypothetical protein [Bacillota bacterium]